MTIEASLGRLSKILGLAAAVAALPLFARFATLEPPWPPGASAISSALVASAVVAASAAPMHDASSRRRAAHVAAGFAVAGLVGYLALVSFFVVGTADGTRRVFIGFTCTADAAAVYRQSCPFLDADALSAAEWRPERLWTPTSLSAIRMGALLAWLVFFVGLAVALANYVAAAEPAVAKSAIRPPVPRSDSQR